VAFVPTLVAVSSAPGTMAPVESFTTPLMEPVTSAEPGTTLINRANASHTIQVRFPMFRMDTPVWSYQIMSTVVDSCQYLRRLAKRSNQHAVVHKGPFVRGGVPERTLDPWRFFVPLRPGGWFVKIRRAPCNNGMIMDYATARQKLVRIECSRASICRELS
jgi:hypothetical protein